jgi:glycosyltransferase involved in cell wall biosynthesis
MDHGYMKFCAVLRSYPKDIPGGAEYQAYHICRELASRGHQTHYVAHQSKETSVETDDGIVVHRLQENGDVNVLDSLADIGADVYYFRIAHDLPLLWRAKRKIEAAFVYNVSRDVQCRSLFAGGPYHDTESLLNNLFNRGRYAMYRFLLRVPDEIFTQSRQQQELLESNHSLRSTVVGNGHPIPETDFEKELPPVVLWLASLKKVKNPETFLDLYEKTRDLDCQFWIVGQAADEEVHELVRQRAADEEKLEYLGGCGILESNDYFKKVAVYVHTGDQEGFPNTFIQSWLYRTPVVSFATDPDSILQTNDIGASCDSLADVESVLRRLITDEEYRAEIGCNAREYAVEHHSIAAIVDKIERQLEHLIEAESNGKPV